MKNTVRDTRNITFQDLKNLEELCAFKHIQSILEKNPNFKSTNDGDEFHLCYWRQKRNISSGVTSEERGLQAEYLVAYELTQQQVNEQHRTPDYFSNQSDLTFELCAHRLRTPYAEVDLLFRSSPLLQSKNNRQEFHLIEVKSVMQMDTFLGEAFMPYRLKNRQKQKLLWARAWLEISLSSFINISIAYVDVVNGVFLLQEVV